MWREGTQMQGVSMVEEGGKKRSWESSACSNTTKGITSEVVESWEKKSGIYS